MTLTIMMVLHFLDAVLHKYIFVLDILINVLSKRCKK